MNWAEVLTIIMSIGAIMGGIVMWLDSKHREDSSNMDLRHRQDMKAMDERWKWLFERTDNKLDQIRGK